MLLAAFICVLLIGIFAGSETVLVSANRIRQRRLAQGGGRQARAVRELLDDPRGALSTALASTAVCTVLAAALATVGSERRWGEEAAGLAAIAQTLAILVLGEAVPKSIGRARADSLLGPVAVVLRVTGVVLWPMLKLATAMSTGLLALFGARPEGRRGILARADLEVLFREAEARRVQDTGEGLDLARVLDLRTTTLAEVMVPHTDMVTVEAGASTEEALAIAAASGHSRLVVYHDTVDAATGVVHIVDLIRAPGRTAGDLAVRVPVFPESVSSLDAFRRLADAQEPVALVADEFGGIAGLVSVSDLVRELTADTPDAVRRADAPIRSLGEHRWLASGRTPTDSFAAIPGFTVPHGAYETLAGYMLSRLGRIPAPGDCVQVGAWRLTVHQADARRILSILIDRGVAGS